jgi:3',5'-cyclic AMP phosphodiesterase CpdA
MKRIIHLSDIHIGYEDLASRFRGIVSKMISSITPAEDHVVLVTGDISEDATREGTHEEARVQFDRLRDAGFHVLVVPGNHDYGTGTVGYSQYVGEFKERFYGTSEVVYPKLDLIGNMAFLGLDSMAEEIHWYDRLFAEGELGEAQLNRLAELLDGEPVKSAEDTIVYLHHHPFHPKPFHQLRDSDDLRDVLRDRGIDALLFGHNHDGHSNHGEWGISRVYDAGSSTGKGGEVGPLRIMDLSRDPSSDCDTEDPGGD